MNLKIPFHSPEEYFLGDPPAKYILGAFNPLDYIPDPIATSDTPVHPIITPPVTPDVILFVGSPASGKSTFYHTYLEPMGYERINQDTLKTRDRCVVVAETALLANKPVCIDNTNAERATRKIWIELARKHGREIRCIQFTASSAVARHNNLVRGLGGVATEKRKVLPLAAIYSFTTRYQEVDLDEGFIEIIKVDFKFSGTDEEKEIWSMWWD
jgi:bifunctional polynucleotide phosphatase/kinase